MANPNNLIPQQNTKFYTPIAQIDLNNKFKHLTDGMPKVVIQDNKLLDSLDTNLSLLSPSKNPPIIIHSNNVSERKVITKFKRAGSDEQKHKKGEKNEKSDKTAEKKIINNNLVVNTNLNQKQLTSVNSNSALSNNPQNSSSNVSSNYSTNTKEKKLPSNKHPSEKSLNKKDNHNNSALNIFNTNNTTVISALNHPSTNSKPNNNVVNGKTISNKKK
jgi:hypothetical protein